MCRSDTVCMPCMLQMLKTSSSITITRFLKWEWKTYVYIRCYLCLDLQRMLFTIMIICYVVPFLQINKPWTRKKLLHLKWEWKTYAYTKVHCNIVVILVPETSLWRVSYFIASKLRHLMVSILYLYLVQEASLRRIFF